MKTKSLKSFGSLVVRGSRFYAFWRVNGKAISKALRDDNGAAITTKPEAEKAKARLMEIVSKQNEVKSLVSIQRAIGDKQIEIDRLNEEKNPPMPLARVWPAFASPTSGRKPVEKSSLAAYENIWTQFQTWLESAHPGVKALRDVKRDIDRKSV